MKRIFVIIFLLSSILMNAEIRTVNMRFVYVANAAIAALSGDESIRQMQTMTAAGAIVEFDMDNSKITLKVPLLDEKEEFLVKEVYNSKEECTNTYKCTLLNDQSEALIMEVYQKNNKFIIMAMPKHGIIFFVTDMTKNELLNNS